MELTISVSDLLRNEDAAPRHEPFTVSQNTFEDIRLSRDVTGDLMLIRLDDDRIHARVQAQTIIAATCDRCLAAFNQPVMLDFERILSLALGSDEIRIDKAGRADLGPSILEEIRLSLPMKLLCKPDCPGIETNPKSETTNPKQIQNSKSSNQIP